LLREIYSPIAAMYLQNRRPKSTLMRYLIFTLFTGLLILLFAFGRKDTDKIVDVIAVPTRDSIVPTKDTIISQDLQNNTISTDQQRVQASSFVEYAKTLTGTPYLYGSVDPSKGLDCSGFINAVSKHFGIKVPRSSVEFTNIGTTVSSNEAEPGNLVLFTGTDATRRVVGHIGIITGNDNGKLKFIHSSSGKAKGVTTSELDEYYKTRFVKVIRIFPTQTDKVIV
jgi:cell wall-associated NlpC family hydrolase